MFRIDTAKELIKLHLYNSREGLWNILNVDGSYGPIDYTFNHQLWFYGMVKLWGINDDQINKCILSFESSLRSSNTFSITPSGYVRHPAFGLTGLKSKLRRLKYLYNSKVRKQYKLKELGYHLFNLLAVTRTGQEIPDYFTDILVENVAKILSKGSFIKNISASPYSFHYNPPAFELIAIMDGLNMDVKSHYGDVSALLNEQFEIFDFDRFTFISDQSDLDISVMNARIYELSLAKKETLSILEF